MRLARSVSDLAEESARIDAAIKDLRERQQPFKAQFKYALDGIAFAACVSHG